MLVVGVLGSGLGMAYSSNPIPGKEADPTLEERLTQDTITGTLTRKEGTLMRKEGEYYYIRDNGGVVQRIHVDKRTKLDKVRTGDLVKAYVTDQGHTTTLQRDN
jgi:hypothetical protein